MLTLEERIPDTLRTRLVKCHKVQTARPLTMTVTALGTWVKLGMNSTNGSVAKLQLTVQMTILCRRVFSGTYSNSVI